MREEQLSGKQQEVVYYMDTYDTHTNSGAILCEVINCLLSSYSARICRSSPQFGVTLATYEILNQPFHLDFGKK